MRLSFALLTTCLLVAACNSAEKAFTRSANGQPPTPATALQSDTFTPPSTWKRIDACGATFYLPAGARREKVRGTDSCVRRYRTDATTFDLDAVPFSTPGYSFKGLYSNRRDFTLRKTKVDGQDAEVISYFDDDVAAHGSGFDYRGVLSVPYITAHRSSFTIRTYSRTAEARAIAMNVFSTVRFAQ